MLLISLVELCHNVVTNDIEQIYVVTPICSFFFKFENCKYSSGFKNVSIDEMVNENAFERDTQKQTLVETLIWKNLF